jgi:hypothetical protein
MDSNVVVTQITAAAIAAYGIQKLKNSPLFPLLSERSATWVKRGYSIVAAIGIHTGVGAIWNPALPNGLAGGDGYNLLIHIPPVIVVITTVWHWICQFVLQEGWYQMAVNKLSITSQPQSGPAITPKVTAQGAVIVPVEPTKP